ncbi:hypothetical protein [Pelistega europaea]|uniref:Uncharacterized protein n=1 Tax=Pelistega europaea TaxID=106147 RepID=A0A7Y4LB43_9BURK|nr:hypothetical protein [Pelistega europaea]NOL50320.1 hypothetical protein [Pelistega europaea]
MPVSTLQLVRTANYFAARFSLQAPQTIPTMKFDLSLTSPTLKLGFPLVT